MQTVTSPSSNPSPSTAVAFHRHLSNTMPPSFETPTSIEVKKDVDDSDVDVERVPELSAMASSSKTRKASGSSRKRTAGPADENKRMKRLLRNRVSAQQARERKKAYMTDLETKIKEIEEKNAELEEKLSTLQRENVMLRQIVRNTTMKGSPIIGMSNFEV